MPVVGLVLEIQWCGLKFSEVRFTDLNFSFEIQAMSNPYPLSSVFFEDAGSIVSLAPPSEGQNLKFKARQPRARSIVRPRPSHNPSGPSPRPATSSYFSNQSLLSQDRPSPRPSGISSMYNEMPSGHDKYKRKYSVLKDHIKELVLVNVACCDLIAEIQDQILVATGKRRCLTKKLLHHQAAMETDNQLQVNDLGMSAGDQMSSTNCSAAKKIVKKRNSGMFDSLIGNGTKCQKDSSRSNAKVHKEVAKTKPLKEPKVTKDGTRVIPKPKKTRTVKQKPCFQEISMTVLKKLVQPIPVDAFGCPVIPIILGDLVIDNLGDIVHDRPAYHTKDIIFPVGFCSTRIYGSTKYAGTRCIYSCRILDGGSYPKFEIIIDGETNKSLVGESPDFCHLKLMQQMDKNFSLSLVKNSPRGAEFFGLNHPVVLNLIQGMSGCKKCPKYKSSRFVVSAAAEEPYDESDPTLSYKALQKIIDKPLYRVHFEEELY